MEMRADSGLGVCLTRMVNSKCEIRKRYEAETFDDFNQLSFSSSSSSQNRVVEYDDESEDENDLPEPR